MNLHILWFTLIGILIGGFFVLEGFDYGVGILLPFVGKGDNERRQVLNSIGPFWDGNEVWLITAGGAMFAAFPTWYATLFSTFYLPMFGILLALILRGAAFEFRSLHQGIHWRRTWDWTIFTGSLLPGFFAGIVVANLLKGIPLDAKMNYVGNALNLFNLYSLLGGLTFVALFTLHGSIFLSLRVEDELRERARRVAGWVWWPTVVLVLLLAVVSYFSSDAFQRLFLNPRIAPVGDLMIASLFSVGLLIARRREGWAFALTSLTIALATLTLELGLFPHVLISSLNPAWSLTIDNAASSPYTLTVISWLALTFVPFVLLYQGWSYWIFRKRLQAHTIGHY